VPSLFGSGSDALEEFTDALAAATEALAAFEGAAGAGGDVGEGAARGEGGGARAPADRGGGTSLTNLARFAAGTAGAGLVGGALRESVRLGVSARDTLSASVVRIASPFSQQLDKRVEAADLAAQRTAAITIPLAGAGGDVSPIREQVFRFQEQIARREVEEKRAVESRAVLAVREAGGGAIEEFSKLIGQLAPKGDEIAGILRSILNRLPGGGSAR
jgi:hypothetical protein